MSHAKTRLTPYRVFCGLLLPAIAMSSAAVGAEKKSAKWQTIFDRKSLKGWKEIGGGKWSIDNGEILGETGDGGFGWLIYEKPLADFVLELECKHDAPGNSGIQFRSHVFPKGEMVGYQAEFDPRQDHGTGGIYEQGGRGWLRKPDEKGLAAMKSMDWNTYRIQAVGDHIQTWVNGVPTIDIHDIQARSGIIAFQIHVGKDTKVRFRNVRVQDLGDGDKWAPLFNGKTLKGWHTQGEPDCWRVENDEIIGELTKPSPYAYLATNKKYTDFEVKADYIFDSELGNSGVFFRCSFPPQCANPKCDPPHGPYVARELPEDVKDFKCPKCGSTECLPMAKRVHIHGPQAEIAIPKEAPCGVVYDARGHGWVNMDKQNARTKAMHHFHEWNEMRVRVVGDHVTVYLNGYLITELTDYKFPKDGIIALQLHAGTATKIRFKNINIRPAAD